LSHHAGVQVRTSWHALHPCAIAHFRDLLAQLSSSSGAADYVAATDYVAAAADDTVIYYY
jgi:hypothetical protein